MKKENPNRMLFDVDIHAVKTLCGIHRRNFNDSREEELKSKMRGESNMHRFTSFEAARLIRSLIYHHSQPEHCSRGALMSGDRDYVDETVRLVDEFLNESLIKK